MISWKCDICGKETMVNPPIKQVYEEKEVNGQKVMIPKMTVRKVQDMTSGKVNSIQVPLIEDQFPRAYILKLNVGPESIQRDVCLDCLTKVKPELDALWKKLEEMESK